MSGGPVPRHLSAAGKRLYKQVLSDYLLEPHHVQILRLLCEALDRAAVAQTAITADGVLTQDRFGVLKPHPAVTVKRDAEVTAARLLRELDLDAETAPDVRVPRRGGGR